MDQLKIPKFQWERFQAALRKSTRDFVTDCAGYIGVPAKDLIAKVNTELNKNPTSIAFFETDEGECEAYISSKHRFAYRCRKPTLTNTPHCHEHQHHRLNVHVPTFAVTMIRLSLPSEYNGPDLWLEETTDRVYNAELQCLGFFDKKSGTLTFFSIEDDLDIGSRDGLSDISVEFEENK
jgi:hypothetical protein